MKWAETPAMHAASPGQNLSPQARDAVLQVPVPAKNPRTVETGQLVRACTTGPGSEPAPAAVSMVSEQGMSLLHLVCALGYEWAARLLLRRGADPELQVS